MADDNNVQFEEEQDFISQGSQEGDRRDTPKMVRLVLKTGLVKSEKGANTLLAILAIVFFALSIYFFSTAF